jgi:hypothetical protein
LVSGNIIFKTVGSLLKSRISRTQVEIFGVMSCDLMNHSKAHGIP